jgi:hypothetical protein
MSAHPVVRLGKLTRWLPDMDLNHDKQIQSLLCYRYTIGQTSVHKVKVSRTESRLLSAPIHYSYRFSSWN